MAVQPTLAGYIAFLTNTAKLEMVNLPPFSGLGTLVEGSTTLTITSATGNLVDNAIVTDANASILVTTVVEQPLVPNPAVGVGTYQMSAAALTTQASPEAISATNEWVLWTFEVALSLVNRAICAASAIQYTLAIYNLATDRVINWAQDIPDQTYFSDLRDKMKLTTPAVGTVTSVGDQGSSVSVVNPEFLKNLTLMDLQDMRTPYGRNYLGIAQQFGPDIFGLS